MFGIVAQIAREISTQAETWVVMKTFFLLFLMGVQFGVLGRLTWWEYSWDIMEPVTYFVTYFTAMGFYAYSLVTGQVRPRVLCVLVELESWSPAAPPRRHLGMPTVSEAAGLGGVHCDYLVYCLSIRYANILVFFD